MIEIVTAFNAPHTSVKFQYWNGGKKMQTFDEMHEKCGSCMYWGDYGTWLVCLGQHRDSNCIDRSNFRIAQQELEAINSDCCVIERENHWAVGWVEHLLINPANAQAVAAGEAIKQRLENYPVLDEEDWSNLEQEEAEQAWKDCYNWKERIEYIRKHESQFEFPDFKCMLDCVRGNSFWGYAGELLH
jgi:hypothetical protein